MYSLSLRIFFKPACRGAVLCLFLGHHFAAPGHVARCLSPPLGHPVSLPTQALSKAFPFPNTRTTHTHTPLRRAFIRPPQAKLSTCCTQPILLSPVASPRAPPPPLSETSVFTSLRPSRRQTTGQKLCGDAVNVRACVCADLCDDRCRLHLNCCAVFTSCFNSVFVFFSPALFSLSLCLFFNCLHFGSSCGGDTSLCAVLCA